MRRILMAVAFVLFTISSAQAAALRTIEFEATNPVLFNDPFNLLGIGAVEIITGSITFDPMAAPLSGPTTTNFGTPDERTDTSRAYTDFSFNFGTFTFGGSPTFIGDRINITDGTGANVQDVFQSNQRPEVAVASGVTLFSFQLFSASLSDLFAGTLVPSIDALNNGNPVFFAITFLDSNGVFHSATYANVTFTEVSAVPLPAAFPLFLSMLAGMGYLRWRRNKRAVV